MGIAARSSLPPDTFLTVNVDPHLLAEDAVAEVLLRAPDLSRFVLELTEHTRTSPDARSLAVLAHVREAGGMLAMDDASLVRSVQVGVDPLACVVLLNAGGHPSRVRDDRDNWAPAMVVAPSTQVAEAARRAMARRVEHRFAPLVCTDGQGRVIGTIGIDDLVTALTSANSQDPSG